jgi:hypothetical protein
MALPFLTPALDEGERSASAQVTLSSGKEPPVPVGYEAVWASEPVWTLSRTEKSFASDRNGTPAVQPVARRYTD